MESQGGTANPAAEGATSSVTIRFRRMLSVNDKEYIAIFLSLSYEFNLSIKREAGQLLPVWTPFLLVSGLFLTTGREHRVACDAKMPPGNCCCTLASCSEDFTHFTNHSDGSLKIPWNKLGFNGEPKFRTNFITFLRGGCSRGASSNVAAVAAAGRPDGIGGRHFLSLLVFRRGSECMTYGSPAKLTTA